jgi:hypothetical protein
MAAFAFWAFIASCVVGGIWYSIREKQAQHETLRKISESGKDVDAEVIERVMNDGSRRDKSEGELKVAGYITMSAAPGLVLLDYFVELASGNEKVFTILLGVAGLVFFVSIGLLVSAKVMERSNASSNDKPLI